MRGTDLATWLGTYYASWQFDPLTALVSVLFVPIFVSAAAVFRSHLKGWTRYAAEGVAYWGGRSVKRSLAGKLTLRRYCRLRLAEDNRYLHVPSSLDIKLDIDEAFVPLSLEGAGSAQVVDHKDLLAAGNRLRVVGDPGCGKSSLVKSLFRDECKRAIETPSAARLPLLIELRNFEVPEGVLDSEMGTWFVQHLKDATLESNVYQMSECFDSWSENAGLLVFLDGLDEVSTGKYQRVQHAILALSAQLARMSDRSVVVLTMRSQFHQQIRHAFRNAFGKTFAIKPFTPSDIFAFLSRWPFSGDRRGTISRIYGDLTDRPTLREMCSNPLVLAMYVAEDQAAGHAVAPDSRTEFYKKVTTELLVRRRLVQTGPTPAHSALLEQRQRILGALALDHLLDPLQPTNSLDWAEAIRMTQEVMNCDGVEAERLFNELAKETGLVSQERAGQTFRFIHLTFCEFLAADEAIDGREHGWQLLIAGHKRLRSDPSRPEVRTRLLEVIPFACGLSSRVLRDERILDVASIGDDGVLARCFLETRRYSHAAWSVLFMRQKERLLTTPEHRWDEEWLKELHLFNVVVQDSLASATHLPATGAPVVAAEVGVLEAFVKNAGASLSKLLAAYAAQDAAAVFRVADLSDLDLLHGYPEIVVSSSDQPPFLGMVVAKATAEDSEAPEWCGLLAEAGLRSAVVADALDNGHPADSLRRRCRELPAARLWYQKNTWRGQLRETLYTQCLTVAISLTPSNEALPGVNILRLVKPPGSVLSGRALLAIVFVSVCASALVARRSSAPYVAQVTFGATYLLFLFSVLRTMAVRVAYWRLIRPGLWDRFEAFGLDGQAKGLSRITRVVTISLLRPLVASVESRRMAAALRMLARLRREPDTSELRGFSRGR